MANSEVMKRLEEIESEFLALGDDVDGYEVERSRFWWLLRLTRALLESQGELLERVGNEECNCEVAKGKTAWECPRCKVLARAERIRKGEV